MYGLDFLNKLDTDKVWNAHHSYREIQEINKQLEYEKEQNFYYRYDPVTGKERTIGERLLKKAVLLIGFIVEPQTVKYVDTEHKSDSKINVKSEKIKSQYIITDPFDIYNSPYMGMDMILHGNVENNLNSTIDTLTKDKIIELLSKSVYSMATENDFILKKVRRAGIDMPKLTLQIRFLSNLDSPIDIDINPEYSLKSEKLPTLEDIEISTENRYNILLYGNKNLAADTIKKFGGNYKSKQKRKIKLLVHKGKKFNIYLV